MQLAIDPTGVVRCVYAEAIDLAELGPVSIRRGSHVEPTDNGTWTADLSPVDGPTLGPFRTRTEALTAEVEWLHANWLVPAGDSTE